MRQKTHPDLIRVCLVFISQKGSNMHRRCIYMVEDPVEMSGWGQIAGNVFMDAASIGEFYLETNDPWMANVLPEMDAMIAVGTWRSKEVSDIGN